MSEPRPAFTTDRLPRYDRSFFDSDNIIGCIGAGSVGGKASGLAFVNEFLKEADLKTAFPNIYVSIPRLVVLADGVFKQFIKRNNLHDLLSDRFLTDIKIALSFQKAEFPAEFVGDLRALITQVDSPLAVRSSSILEDAMHEPFAGVYATKMVPNNDPDIDKRFRKLIEAIKFVYASTFFENARNYRLAIGKNDSDEEMAVIIQQVVGHRYGNSYYPHVSGVARSYNFYAFGQALPDQGVVDLAFGLGKTIVDGGLVWSYCPELPNNPPPVASARELLKITQTSFWAVNMGKPEEYDPTRESEFMIQDNISSAEYDQTLQFVASTYQPQNDRLVMGVGSPGPRVLNFAPLLKGYYVKFNELIKNLIGISEKAFEAEVEIEFAANISKDGKPTSFGFLQVRPMVVSHNKIEIDDVELGNNENLISSKRVLGNGIVDNIRDVVYVDPETFAPEATQQVAEEISNINKGLAECQTPYLLIGFGRWGSSDPWLGIPIEWSQISYAKTIVEATLPKMNVELSQGSHFFHNLSSFQICYFLIHYNDIPGIDWEWLAIQKEICRTEYVRHVRLKNPLNIRVDGRSGRGVIAR